MIKLTPKVIAPTSRISCSCGDDIDLHLVKYNEQTDTFRGGLCTGKGCGCQYFALAYPDHPLSVYQTARLAFDYRTFRTPLQNKANAV